MSSYLRTVIASANTEHGSPATQLGEPPEHPPEGYEILTGRMPANARFLYNDTKTFSAKRAAADEEDNTREITSLHHAFVAASSLMSLALENWFGELGVNGKDYWILARWRVAKRKR